MSSFIFWVACAALEYQNNNRKQTMFSNSRTPNTLHKSANARHTFKILDLTNTILYCIDMFGGILRFIWHLLYCNVILSKWLTMLRQMTVRVSCSLCPPSQRDSSWAGPSGAGASGRVQRGPGGRWGHGQLSMMIRVWCQVSVPGGEQRQHGPVETRGVPLWQGCAGDCSLSCSYFRHVTFWHV